MRLASLGQALVPCLAVLPVRSERRFTNVICDSGVLIAVLPLTISVPIRLRLQSIPLQVDNFMEGRSLECFGLSESVLLSSSQQDQRGEDEENYVGELLLLLRNHKPRVEPGTYEQRQPKSRKTAAPLSRLTVCYIASRGVAGLVVVIRTHHWTTPELRLASAALTEANFVQNAVLSVVYVSEGINNSLLDELASAASAQPGAALLRQFRDPIYHRTGYTIGGRCPSSVAEASVEISRHALGSIDLRQHKASHPRVGVVDHVSVHALGLGVEGAARQAGMTIARSLAAEGLPVLLYGDLKNGRSLAEVRRSTTYFVGGEFETTIEADLGPNEIDASRGVVTVGCTPLVMNYNILLGTDDKRLAAQVTRRVREKDGGLRWVEALTLKRDDGRYETACNLLRPKETTPAMVLEVAQAQAELVGVRVVKEYETGLTEEQALEALSLVAGDDSD